MGIEQHKTWILLVLFVFVTTATLYVFQGTQPSPEAVYDTSETPPVPGTYPEFEPRERELLGLIQGSPENDRLIERLGDLYFESGDYQRAIVQYEDVLTLNPGDADTYNDLGLALHYTGNTEAAIETLQKGTTIDPTFQRIWLSLGFVLASYGDLEKAKSALEEAIRLAPDTEVGLEARRMLSTFPSQM